MSRILILILTLTFASYVMSAEPPKIFTNSISMKFKLIPAGEFMMGSPESEKGRDDDEQQHLVRITRPFYVGGSWRSLSPAPHMRSSVGGQ